MPTEREEAQHKAWVAVGADALGIGGFAISRYAESEGVTFLLGGLFGVEEGTALAIAAGALGGIAGGLALAVAPLAVGALAAAYLAAESSMHDVAGAADLAGYAMSPGQLAATPFLPVLGTSGVSVVGTYLDFGTGVTGAGSIGEMGAATAGFGLAGSQPEFQQGETDLAKRVSDLLTPTQGANPGPTPTPQPGPTPIPEQEEPGYPGSVPELYPFAPGLGDSGFGGLDSSPDTPSDPGYSGVYNGSGFDIGTTIINGSSPENPGAPPVPEPPEVPEPPPDPPEPPPEPPEPTPEPPEPPGPPPPMPTPPPPGGDDDDDDE